MRKKQIVLRRRLLVGGVCAAVVLLVFLLVRALYGMAGAEEEKPPEAPRYHGEPVSAETYRNVALDLPEAPWNLMLVSKKYPLAEGYVPVLATVQTRWEVDARIAEAVEKMFSDCKEAGLNPMICSAFRSVDKQDELFAGHADRSRADGPEGEDAADVVAVPGASEHHTGLALDIVSYDYQLLDEGQELSPENEWLREHCAEYGFILRYPDGKSEETGIIYEPWHFRYVGTEAAEEIMGRGITLEEYAGVT